jgi:hypothetical protein
MPKTVVKQNPSKPTWAQYTARKMAPALRVQADVADQIGNRLRQLADGLEGGPELTNDQVGECEILVEMSNEMRSAISEIATRLDRAFEKELP